MIIKCEIFPSNTDNRKISQGSRALKKQPKAVKTCLLIMCYKPVTENKGKSQSEVVFIYLLLAKWVYGCFITFGLRGWYLLKVVNFKLFLLLFSKNHNKTFTWHLLFILAIFQCLSHYTYRRFFRMHMPGSKLSFGLCLVII